MGNSEIVSMLVTLKAINAEDFAVEVQRLLTKEFGKIIVLPTGNSYLLQDRADSLRRLLGTIKRVEDDNTGLTQTLEHKCVSIKASEAAETVKIHLGVEADFRPAKKAHPGLLVDDLGRLIGALELAGHRVNSDEPLEGYHRVYVDDPFGNRLELMEVAGLPADR